MVKPKKHLGQHFLTDQSYAQKIAKSLTRTNYNAVLEIGPGTGVLTQFLLERKFETHVIEVDVESIDYLKVHLPKLGNRIIHADFLRWSMEDYFKDQVAIIGNFPYNISSQIVFKTLEKRHLVPEFAGMFQLEVAKRICAGPGSKTYGILSVLTQAFYNTHYLFDVPPAVFYPPPKVTSGVIRLVRKEHVYLSCDEDLFFKVVKTAFQQRRKTLRNSLKSFGLSNNLKEDSIFGQRPEELGVKEFILLTKRIADETFSA